MKSDGLPEISAKLAPVFHRHAVRRAIVFGSLARGDESRRSDLDLIVIQETDKRFLDRYDALASEITACVAGRDVDLLIYTERELAQIRDRPLIASALREGKVIYESEQESLPSCSKSSVVGGALRPA